MAELAKGGISSWAMISWANTRPNESAKGTCTILSALISASMRARASSTLSIGCLPKWMIKKQEYMLYYKNTCYIKRIVDTEKPATPNKKLCHASLKII